MIIYIGIKNNIRRYINKLGMKSFSER